MLKTHLQSPSRLTLSLQEKSKRTKWNSNTLHCIQDDSTQLHFLCSIHEIATRIYWKHNFAIGRIWHAGVQYLAPQCPHIWGACRWVGGGWGVGLSSSWDEVEPFLTILPTTDPPSLICYTFQTPLFFYTTLNALCLVPALYAQAKMLQEPKMQM